MAFNPARCVDTLRRAVSGSDHGEFIYRFLQAYEFPRATITQACTGDPSNLATRKIEGYVALKNWLCFMPLRRGENIHKALRTLADGEFLARHKTRLLVVTDYDEFTDLPRPQDRRLERVPVGIRQ